MYVEIGFAKSVLVNATREEILKSQPCTSIVPHWNEEFMFPVTNRQIPLLSYSMHWEPGASQRHYMMYYGIRASWLLPASC